jgi:hypothetical protein
MLATTRSNGGNSVLNASFVINWKEKKEKKFNHAKFVHVEIGHCNIHFNPYFEE